MKKKRNYYRTAALLGAQPRQNATRSRFRSRSRPQLRLRVSWKVIVILAIIVAVALWLRLDDRWYVDAEDVNVIGATHSTTAQEILKMADLLGWHGMSLPVNEARDRILVGVPAVTGAEITCVRFPASCTITVAERVPVVTWRTESMSYWVDAEGYVFPAQRERDDLPIVRGPVPLGEEEARIPVEVLDGIKALYALGIPSDGLEYNSLRGLIWVDTEGRRVAFGAGSEMESRWVIYRALVADLEARDIFPWVIDVRFPAGPTYALDRSW